jgi:hypothetical protein
MLSKIARDHDAGFYLPWKRYSAVIAVTAVPTVDNSGTERLMTTLLMGDGGSSAASAAVPAN